MENKRIKIVIEIMALAFIINEKTDYCVFIRFSGHVGGMDIDIKNSKKDYITRIAGTDFYTNPRGEKPTDEKFLEHLEGKKAMLEKILNDKKIPFEEMTKIVESYSHVF